MNQSDNIKQKQILRAIRLSWPKRFIGLSLIAIAILAVSAGCGCSAKQVAVSTNFNFNTFSLSKLMIMNLEDGHHVFDYEKNIKQRQQPDQDTINTLFLSPISHAQGSSEPHNNTKFFSKNNNIDIPFSKNAFKDTKYSLNSIVTKQQKLNSTWQKMFIPASTKTDPNFKPTTPYDNFLFAHFNSFFDYRNSQVITQNAKDVKNIKPTKKTTIYNKSSIGSVCFGDWDNKFKKHLDKNKEATFALDDAFDPSKGGHTAYTNPNGKINTNGTVNKFFPIQISIAANYINPYDTSTDIVGSEIDITMQFIFNLSIFQKIDKGIYTKGIYTFSPNENFLNLIHNLQLNDNNNSPMYKPFYENIFQFENVTSIKFKN